MPLGTVQIPHSSPGMQVDYIYALSQTSANSNTGADFKKLEGALAELKPDERVLVSAMMHP